MRHRRHCPLRPRVLALLLAVAAFALSAVCEAGNTSGADVLFQAAREAMADGDYELACQKFEESNRLERAAGTLLNLGNCEEKRGRVATSWARYTEAMDMLMPNDARYAFAKKKAEALEPRIPRLTVQISKEAPRRTTVTRDGKEWTEPLGTPLRLDPQFYVIVVSAPQHESQTYELTLAEGDIEELIVSPGRRIPDRTKPAPSPRTKTPTDDGDRRRLGLIIGGVGAAAAIAGITFGALTYNEYQTVTEHCDIDTRTCFDRKGDEAASRGASFELLAYGLGGIGAAGLSVGGYLLLSEDDKEATVLEVGQVGRVSTVRLRTTF
jgi:hypothetical protein